jgi:hypothetical protein
MLTVKLVTLNKLGRCWGDLGVSDVIHYVVVSLV